MLMAITFVLIVTPGTQVSSHPLADQGSTRDGK